MANLKDLIVNGSARIIGKLFTNKIEASSIESKAFYTFDGSDEKYGMKKENDDASIVIGDLGKENSGYTYVGNDLRCLYSIETDETIYTPEVDMTNTDEPLIRLRYKTYQDKSQETEYDGICWNDINNLKGIRIGNMNNINNNYVILTNDTICNNYLQVNEDVNIIGSLKIDGYYQNWVSKPFTPASGVVNYNNEVKCVLRRDSAHTCQFVFNGTITLTSTISANGKIGSIGNISSAFPSGSEARIIVWDASSNTLVPMLVKSNGDIITNVSIPSNHWLSMKSSTIGYI